MRLLLALIRNDLIKMINYKSFIYLIVLMSFSLILSALVTMDKQTMQFFRFSGAENSFTLFYSGQFLFVSVFGQITINLIVIFLFRIEENAGSWKHLFTLPVNPYDILSSKLVAGIVLNFCITLMVFSLILLEGLFVPVFTSEQSFSGYVDSIPVLLNFGIRFFLLSISISSFHFALYLLIRNQAILIVIGIFIPFVCYVDFLSFLPYSWPFRNYWEIVRGNFLWSQLSWSYEVLSCLIMLSVFAIIHHFKSRIISLF